MKKFKSVISGFSQESEVVNSWEGSFTGGYLSRIGIDDVEIPSGSPLDKEEYLGKEVTIIIGGDQPEVEHPSHYNQGNIETIEMIKEITNGYTGFEGSLVGNVVKYLDRAPYKENKMQDIKKAQFYLNCLVVELETELEE